jgi:maltose-binding protein MalE
MKPYAAEVAASASVLMSESKESFDTVYGDIKDFTGKFANVYYQTGSAAELFKEYGEWVFGKIRGEI